MSGTFDPPSIGAPPVDEQFETEQVNNLLIEELALWGEALSQNEASGEGRVTIFLAAVGAAATAFPAVMQREEALGRAMLPFLFGFLLLVGLSTLFRLVKRNLETDQCQRRLWLIRSHFGEKYADRLPAWGYPRGMVDAPKVNPRRRNWLSLEFFFGRGGGHVELVEWGNALLFGLLVYGVATGGVELDRVAFERAFCSAVLFRTGEFAWGNWMYQREEQSAPRPAARVQEPLA